MHSTSQHTPGPWGAYKSSHWWIQTGQVVIAKVIDGPTGIEQEANATLIAAAPAMYFELVKQRDWLLHIKGQVQAPASIMLGFDQSIKYINSALTQAEGKL